VQRRPEAAAAGSLLALLSAAQRTYTAAIRSALAASGFADLPLTGYRIAISLRSRGLGLQELADTLSVSKQAASRLVDVLVTRGYCVRASDATDRRRATLTLTDRGQDAAREIRRAVGRLNDALAAHVDANDIATTRAVLEAVETLGRERAGAAR
jgi:DNA-binding MarR family transcriptional regulator